MSSTDVYESPCLSLVGRSIEYNVSYVYHALYAYFTRDNVALPGMAAFFKAGSDEERGHAELLMDFQVWPCLPSFTSSSRLSSR